MAAADAHRTHAEEKLFLQIYGAHLEFMWRCLRRFGVWERDLEDAAHDAFVVVHRRLGDFDQSRPVKPWLLGIAFRVASDFRKKAQHRHESLPGDGESMATHSTSVHAHTANPEELAAQHQRRVLVQTALSDLEDHQRDVFVLHELEGHTMPEIAALLRVPLNTCYSRLRLARVRFAQAVRQHEQQGGPR